MSVGCSSYACRIALRLSATAAKRERSLEYWRAMPYFGVVHPDDPRRDTYASLPH